MWRFFLKTNNKDSSNKDSNDRLSNLPAELILLTLEYLPLESVCTLGGVSKNLRNLTIYDNLYWESKLRKEFPKIYKKYKPSNPPWFQLYRTVYSQHYDQNTHSQKQIALFRHARCGNYQALLKANLSFEMLEAKDKTQQSLLMMIMENIEQGETADEYERALLYAIYSIAQKHFAEDKSNKLLFYVCIHGLTKATDELTGNTPELASSNERKQTPLLLAALNGRVNTVEMLLEKNENFQAKDAKNNNLLHCAMRSGSLELIQFLAQQPFFSAQLNSPNINGISPFHTAIKYKQADIVEFILSIQDHDAKEFLLNKEDNMSRCPLHLAAKSGHVETISALLSAGVTFNNPNYLDYLTTTPLEYALQHENVTRYLLWECKNDSPIKVVFADNGYNIKSIDGMTSDINIHCQYLITCHSYFAKMLSLLEAYDYKLHQETGISSIFYPFFFIKKTEFEYFITCSHDANPSEFALLMRNLLNKATLSDTQLNRLRESATVQSMQDADEIDDIIQKKLSSSLTMTP